MLLWILPIALDRTLPACITIHSKVRSQDSPKNTLGTLLSTYLSKFSRSLPPILSRTLLFALHGTLLACLNHTPKYAPKTLSSTLPNFLPSKLSRGNLTWRYALKYAPQTLSSTLPNRLPSTLSRGNLTWSYAPMYASSYSIQKLAELQVPGTGRWEGGCWWQ